MPDLNFSSQYFDIYYSSCLLKLLIRTYTYMYTQMQILLYDNLLADESLHKSIDQSLTHKHIRCLRLAEC